MAAGVDPEYRQGVFGMRSIFVAVALLAMGSQLALAAPAGAPDTSKNPSAANAAALPSAEGEVRKVDKAAGKITLKHGPIANLDMPGMTMVFRVSDLSLLDKVKAGDKVRFTAERVDGALTVVQMEPAS
jgi:Cu(I)/Ag(I) efflux system protein CusF